MRTPKEGTLTVQASPTGAELEEEGPTDWLGRSR